MCRILLLSGSDLEQAKTALSRFHDLAECGTVPLGAPKGHQDGWGLLHYVDQVPELNRQAAPATGSQEYERVTSLILQTKNRSIMGHLRKSSVGTVALNNTHPFIYGNFGFCHNGTIFNSADIPLSPHYVPRLTSDTDSERFFMFIIQLLETTPGASILLAIQAALDWVRKHADYTALNAILTTPQSSFAIREVNENNEKVMDMDLLDSYYGLYAAKDAIGTIRAICSEKLDIAGLAWVTIENHRVIEVNAHNKTR